MTRPLAAAMLAALCLGGGRGLTARPLARSLAAPGRRWLAAGVPPGRSAAGWGNHHAEGEDGSDDLRHRRLFVQGLPPHVGWRELKDHCRAAGVPEVVYASVSTDRITRASKGHGIVELPSPAAAQEAMLLVAALPLDGNTLTVRPDRQERARRGRGGDSSGGRPWSTTTWGSDQEQHGTFERRQRRSPAAAAPPTALEPRVPIVYSRASDDDQDAAGSAGLDQARVEALLQQRAELRATGRFDEADEVRQEIHELGVKVDDRRGKWWTMDTVPDSVRAARSLWRFTGDAAGLEAQGVQVEQIQLLLHDRDRHRRAMEYEEADRILAILRNEHGVMTNDGEKLWALAAEAY